GPVGVGKVIRVRAIPYFLDILFRIGFRQVYIALGLVQHFHILCSAQHFRQGIRLLYTIIAMVADYGLLVLLPFFGSDQYNAIGCTRTVDSCGGSVLQHGNAFYIRRVQVVEIARYAVYQYKWAGIIGGTNAPYMQGSIGCAWVARTIDSCKAWQQALQGGRHRSNRPALQLLFSYHSHSPGKVYLLLGAIAYYHHLVQLAHIFAQHHI